MYVRMYIRTVGRGSRGTLFWKNLSFQAHTVLSEASLDQSSRYVCTHMNVVQFTVAGAHVHRLQN